jgi:hypothetical protein
MQQIICTQDVVVGFGADCSARRGAAMYCTVPSYSLEYGRHGDVGQYIARPFVSVLWSGFRRHRRRSPWLFRVILEVRFFISRHNF